MSGVEILGTGAAALQVAQTTISIASMVWELYHQDPPKSIRNHLSQVSSLAAAATIIEQEPRLHIKPIQDLVHSTLERTSALRKSLQHTQHQYGEGAWLRYKSIYINRLQEKELLRDLDSLEKEKSCLVLCISTIQTGYLGNIIDLIQQQPISCPNTQMPQANIKVRMVAPEQSTAGSMDALASTKVRESAATVASETLQNKASASTTDGSNSTKTRITTSYSNNRNIGRGLQNNGYRGIHTTYTERHGDFGGNVNMGTGMQNNGPASADVAKHDTTVWASWKPPNEKETKAAE